MRFHIQTFGCRVNVAESDRLALELERAGWQPYLDSKADLTIVNSCAVTGKAEREARQYINRIRQLNPKGRIIATGCAASLWQKQRTPVKGLDRIYDNADKEYLSKLLLRDSKKAVREKMRLKAYGKFLTSGRLMVKVQDGCDYFCTYCIVPYLRGRSRTIGASETVAYIKATAEKLPIHEVVITGINLGLYPDLPNLVKTLADRTEIKKISFGSLYMENLDQDFLGLYQSDLSFRLTRYFHVPLQSGSQAVLSLMRRRYTLAEYTDRVRALSEKIPDGLIATDIIVGYLGETDREFTQTYQYLKDSPISKAHIFKFSKRNYTAAFYLSKRIEEPQPLVKEKRSRLLHKLFADKLSQFSQTLIGQNLRAMVIRQYPNYMLGFLDNGLEVVIPANKPFKNAFVNVKIEKISQNKLLASLAA